MKAWQREIRESRQKEDSDADLFGRWWESIDTDISKAEVRPCSVDTAKHIIEQYEWLGCMPGFVMFTFGIFWQGHCGGVVVYRPEYSENLGIQAREQGRKCADWSKYGYEGKMLLLARGACVHWAHPHAASKLIRRSMDLLPAKYEVITATTDPAAGEIGTIYQACGFHYVGSMRDNNPNFESKPDDRGAWVLNGKIVGSRYMRLNCGTSKARDVAKIFPTATRIQQYSKHRYFGFRGSAGARKRHMKAIQHLIKPYPKRDRDQERSGGDQSQGVGQFDGHAPLLRESGT